MTDEAIAVHAVGTLPVTQKHHGDAGHDITAAEDTWIEPGEWETVGTNLSTAIPYGYYATIESRSGLAVKHGIEAFRGIVDAGYRGEYLVKLTNNGREGFAVHAGDRIAQLIFHKSIPVAFIEVDELNQSTRGISGFGSTGVAEIAAQ